MIRTALRNPIAFQERLIPDEKERISATLVELVGDKLPSSAHWRKITIGPATPSR